jgi:hypothetical protein
MVETNSQETIRANHGCFQCFVEIQGKDGRTVVFLFLSLCVVLQNASKEKKCTSTSAKNSYRF